MGKGLEKVQTAIPSLFQLRRGKVSKALMVCCFAIIGPRAWLTASTSTRRGHWAWQGAGTATEEIWQRLVETALFEVPWLAVVKWVAYDFEIWGLLCTLCILCEHISNNHFFIFFPNVCSFRTVPFLGILLSVKDFELLPQIVAPDSPRQESARGSCIGRDLGWEGWRDSLSSQGVLFLAHTCSSSKVIWHLRTRCYKNDFARFRTQCHNQMCRLRHFGNSRTAWGELCVPIAKKHKRRRDMHAQILAQDGSNIVG